MVRINQKICTGCGNCVEVCPFGVLEMRGKKVVVAYPEKCKRCGACIAGCPNNAIETEV